MRMTPPLEPSRDIARATAKIERELSTCSHSEKINYCCRQRPCKLPWSSFPCSWRQRSRRRKCCQSHQLQWTDGQAFHQWECSTPVDKFQWDKFHHKGAELHYLSTLPLIPSSNNDASSQLITVVVAQLTENVGCSLNKGRLTLLQTREKWIFIKCLQFILWAYDKNSRW